MSLPCSMNYLHLFFHLSSCLSFSSSSGAWGETGLKGDVGQLGKTGPMGDPGTKTSSYNVNSVPVFVSPSRSFYLSSQLSPYDYQKHYDYLMESHQIKQIVYSNSECIKWKTSYILSAPWKNIFTTKKERSMEFKTVPCMNVSSFQCHDTFSTCLQLSTTGYKNGKNVAVRFLQDFNDFIIVEPVLGLVCSSIIILKT